MANDLNYKDIEFLIEMTIYIFEGQFIFSVSNYLYASLGNPGYTKKNMVFIFKSITLILATSII